MRDRYEIDSNYTAEEARIIAGVRYAINVRYLINTSTIFSSGRGYEA